MTKKNQLVREALCLVVDRCPRLSETCYWAGTSSIAIEELDHRESFDLDFHTRRALVDVNPILTEIQQAFGDSFSLVQPPDSYGSGFSGVLSLAEGEEITIEVLSNFEDATGHDLVEAETTPKIHRISLMRYLQDKIQCVAERAEARDLIDIAAVLEQRPDFEAAARRGLAEQDALLITERLQAWTDELIEQDLEAYPEVDPKDAGRIRDLLLSWLKSETGQR